VDAVTGCSVDGGLGGPVAALIAVRATVRGASAAEGLVDGDGVDRVDDRRRGSAWHHRNRCSFL
jgi:hypothetical protein